MRKVTALALVAATAAIAAGVSSCGVLPFMAKLTMGTDFKFDMKGARAIAMGGGATGRSAADASVARAAADSSALVKVLENGVVQPLVDFGPWTPEIAFIAAGSEETGDAGSVYICFQWAIQSVDGFVQFIRVNPDNSYTIIWPLKPNESNYSGPVVATWSWWGMDSDPLVKGPDGKLYFKVSNNSGNAMEDAIYAYDPRKPTEASRRITPENASLAISTFMVDAKEHVFIQSANNWGSSSASFLRYYTKDVVAPNNIYYSSEQNTWVRGYTVDHKGDYVVMNGNNIRGMNGIIKANIINESTVEYDLVYPNANSAGNWINLTKWEGSSWTSPTNVLLQMQGGSSYKWLSEVLTNDSFDSVKFTRRVSSYFKFGNSLVFKVPAPAWWPMNNDLNASVYGSNESVSIGYGLKTKELTKANYPSMTIGQLLSHWEFAEYALCEIYEADGSTGRPILFKDWLNKPENLALKEINFDMVGTMVWASDGLYGLYSNSWWGGGGSDRSAKVIKLLDRDGNPDLKMISLDNGDKSPTLMKVNGDYIYYRYAILDSFNQETGRHRLARRNFVTGIEEELLGAVGKELEITNYDVSSGNEYLYFVGFDSSTNSMFGGKIDLNDAHKSFSKMDTTTKLSKIRIIH